MPPEIKQAVYLHGLASSPKSTKASYLKQVLESGGVSVAVPDLNLPSFESLSAHAVVEEALRVLADLPDQPTLLIGSSFGCFAALHALAHATPEAIKVKKLVLLAPAIYLACNRELTPAVREHWKKAGSVNKRHSGTGTERRLPFSFLEGMLEMGEPSPPKIPTLLIHGTRDQTIEFEGSVKFSKTSPLIQLVPLNTDHSMESCLAEIGVLVEEFLKLPR